MQLQLNNFIKLVELLYIKYLNFCFVLLNIVISL